MMRHPRRILAVWLSGLLLLAAAGALWWLHSTPPVVEPEPPHHLSMMAEVPDWSVLDAYQQSITRSDFEQLLAGVYTAGDGWSEWIRIDEQSAEVRTYGDAQWRLVFGEVSRDLPQARYWRTREELPAAPVGRPLQGLHVAIDPGHIGGEWARIEERWLQVGDGVPICEGDMTLLVAQLLRTRLEGLGAKVSLVRDRAEPVTDLRPEDFMTQALAEQADPDKARRLAERWFYRTAEIHARAKRVNETIRPDLVLCLHFNADAWGDPENPQLSEKSHVHLLVHGGYGDDELAFEDQRHALLSRLLSRSHREEVAVGAEVCEVFKEATKLPPFQYSPTYPYVSPVEGHSCLWARNLLANRLYDCPVMFLEPYVMNSKPDYPRMQAGDYVGLREVAGVKQVSIFREYAEVVCAGLVRHYGKR